MPRGKSHKIASFKKPGREKVQSSGQDEQQRLGKPWANLIVEGLEEPIFSLDRDWRFTFLNNQAAELLGQAKETLLGKIVWEEFPTLRDSNFGRFYRQAMQEGKPSRIEDFSFTTEAWYEVRAYPIPEGLIVYLQDINERKQLEQSLLESEKRFKVLSEASFEGVLIHHDRIIVEANERASKLLGYSSSQEMIGQTIDTHLTPQSLRELQQRIAEGSEEAYEGVAITREGQEFPVEARGKLAEYKGQDVRVKVIRDITERKQLEQQLRESENRLNGIINSATDAIITVNSEQQVVLFNKAAEKMFGYLASDIVGQPLDRFIPPKYRLIHQQHIVSFGNTGVSSRGMSSTLPSLSGIRNTGEEFPIEATISQVEVGRQKLFTVIIRDITERKQLEQQLRESEEHYKALSEATFEAVVLHNDGIIVDANQTTADMFGYSSPQECIGLSIFPLVAPESVEEVQRRVATGSMETYEALAQKKDGTPFPVEVRSRIIEYRGQVLRVAAFKNIAERKYAEEVLRRTQAQLLQSQKMEGIGRLAGGIAHDFNNLLTAIVGYTELILLRMREDDQLYNDVVEIQNAAERATSLTRQLLAFSRQQVLQPKVINLNKVVEQISKLLQRLIGEDIELKTSLNPQLGEVLADQGQIEQVILNLVVNARDAMPNGGQLTIETTNVELYEQFYFSTYPQIKSGSYVMLAISDNGVGMDRATQEKVFEPFFTTKEAGKGTGLGLATVYGIVNQSDGYVWVYSEVGIGTTFKVYLPRINASALPGSTPVLEERSDASSQPRTEQHGTSGEGYTVLVVEDEPVIKDLIQRVLTEAGYNIIGAYNGQQALELFNRRQNEIDLIITDIIMPQMGGREFIERVRADNLPLKVLCMSGYTDQAIQHHKLLQQCDAFLQKPFTPQALLDKLHDLLKS